MSNRNNNAGQLSIATDGDLGRQIAPGLTIDLNDGDLGMQIAPGLSIDF